MPIHIARAAGDDPLHVCVDGPQSSGPGSLAFWNFLLAWMRCRADHWFPSDRTYSYWPSTCTTHNGSWCDHCPLSHHFIRARMNIPTWNSGLCGLQYWVCQSTVRHLDFFSSPTHSVLAFKTLCLRLGSGTEVCPGEVDDACTLMTAPEAGIGSREHPPCDPTA